MKLKKNSVMNFPPFITNKNKENTNKLLKSLFLILFKSDYYSFSSLEVFSWIL